MDDDNARYAPCDPVNLSMEWMVVAEIIEVHISSMKTCWVRFGVEPVHSDAGNADLIPSGLIRPDCDISDFSQRVQESGAVVRYRVSQGRKRREKINLQASRQDIAWSHEIVAAVYALRAD